MLRGMRLLEMEQRIDHFQYVMLIGGLFHTFQGCA